jgi:hypothetical protein
LNFSQTGIANVALQRIGARGTISSINEDSPNAIKVRTCWDYVFQEVLSERDWKFAKTRVALQQNANRPVGGYRYAYALPADFLRLCKPKEIPEERRIANAAEWGWGGGSFGWFRSRDIPVCPREVHPYITETVLDPQPLNNTYNTNLLTDYPFGGKYPNVIFPPTDPPPPMPTGFCRPIVINYIRLITDMSQLFPGFVNCLCNRLAAELAPSITEDMKKADTAMQMYFQTLNSAQAQQEADDYLQDEAGSQTWVQAGRYGWDYGRGR